MYIKVDFGNAHRGILYGEVTTSEDWDLLNTKDISLDTPVHQFEFAGFCDANDTTSLFKDFLGHTGNASYDSKMVLEDGAKPDYQPTLRDYLKYVADRVVEEGHTESGLDITVSKPNGNAKTNLTYSDLAR